MLPRSRSARFAALALAITTPLVAANALPAFAAGESASATLTSPESDSATTFTWSYTFSGTHGLSNIAIAFCSADILADVASAGPSATIFSAGDVEGGHTGFGPGIKFGVTAPTGTFTVTFSHPHSIAPNALQIQSHSGDGQTGDAITTADGPGSCPVDPTDDGDGDDGGSGSGGTGSGGTGSGGTGNGGTGNGGTTGVGDDVLGTVAENNGGGGNGGTQTTASPADPAVTSAAQPTNVPTVSPNAGTTVSPTLGTTVSGNDFAAVPNCPAPVPRSSPS